MCSREILEILQVVEGSFAAEEEEDVGVFFSKGLVPLSSNFRAGWFENCSWRGCAREAKEKGPMRSMSGFLASFEWSRRLTGVRSTNKGHHCDADGDEWVPLLASTITRWL